VPVPRLEGNAPVLQLRLSPVGRTSEPIRPIITTPEKIVGHDPHAAGSRVGREDGVAVPFQVEVVADAADPVVDFIRSHVQAAERAAFLVVPGQDGGGVGVDGDGGGFFFGGAEVGDALVAWEGLLVAR
jgi:hypothetical protein